jgi:RNA polymerase-interacting CarD/CdnL/TRCF family regulator
MGFHAGDAVMHWTYGLGTIIRLEKRELLGREAMYYAVKIGDMTVWVPRDDNLGHRLRAPSSKAAFKRLVALLGKKGAPLPQDRHERKLMLAELLKDGRAASLCEVIRSLAAYKLVRSLNDNDQALLRRVQSALLAEWGYCLEITPAEAQVQMYHLLESAAT